MGTTICAAGLLVSGQLALVHVGDSRAYLWHEGALTPADQGPQRDGRTRSSAESCGRKRLLSTPITGFSPERSASRQTSRLTAAPLPSRREIESFSAVTVYSTNCPAMRSLVLWKEPRTQLRSSTP